MSMRQACKDFDKVQEVLFGEFNTLLQNWAEDTGDAMFNLGGPERGRELSRATMVMIFGEDLIASAERAVKASELYVEMDDLACKVEKVEQEKVELDFLKRVDEYINDLTMLVNWTIDTPVEQIQGDYVEFAGKVCLESEQTYPATVGRGVIIKYMRQSDKVIKPKIAMP